MEGLFDFLPMPTYQCYQQFREEHLLNIPAIKQMMTERPEAIENFFSGNSELEQEIAAALPEEYEIYLKSRQSKRSKAE